MEPALAATASIARAVAVLGIAIAGLLWIVGLHAARDRALRVAIASFVIGLLIPYIYSYITNAFGTVHVPEFAAPDVNIPALLAIVAGHIALAVVIIRRRLRGRDDDARHRDVERTRTRERTRLPTHVNEDEE